MHTPVLLKETINALRIKPGGLYIDATAGVGGHLRELLKNDIRLLALDWDGEQIAHLKRKFKENKKVIFKTGNFAQIKKIAEEFNFFPVDGVLFDLGISIEQMNKGRRGFSYKNIDEPLDMRLSGDLEKKTSDIINSCSEIQLYEILARYSEEINSLAISQNIVRARAIKPILTVGDLIMVIDNTQKQKDKRVYARIFQALRVAVNNEFVNLKEGLEGALSILNPDGVLALITFHSLEDRIVKLFSRSHGLNSVTAKFEKNKKKRFEQSAKLRIINKPC